MKDFLIAIALSAAVVTIASTDFGTLFGMDSIDARGPQAPSAHLMAPRVRRAGALVAWR